MMEGLWEHKCSETFILRACKLVFQRFSVTRGNRAYKLGFQRFSVARWITNNHGMVAVDKQNM